MLPDKGRTSTSFFRFLELSKKFVDKFDDNDKEKIPDWHLIQILAVKGEPGVCKRRNYSGLTGEWIAR